MIKNFHDVDFTPFNTFHVPVKCDRVIAYYGDDSEYHLKKIVGHDLDDAIIIGRASNILFSSSRCTRPILNNCHRSFKLSSESNNEFFYLTVSAGTPLDHICEISAQTKVWGLENLSGIPGNFGGAIVQNAGAYGAEIKDVVESVRCLCLSTGEIVEFTAEECRFGYRTSIFKHPDFASRYFIFSVFLRLRKNSSPNFSYPALKTAFEHIPMEKITPADVRETVLKIRNSKLPDPDKVGSAGSFFKNPVVNSEKYAEICSATGETPTAIPQSDGTLKLSAAWLIDHAGCKSMRVGGAAIWPQVPIVLVNADGTATGADILNLAEEITNRVESKYGITLQPEVIVI